MSNRLFDPADIQRRNTIQALNSETYLVENLLPNWRTWAQQTGDANLLATVEHAVTALGDVREAVREMMRG